MNPAEGVLSEAWALYKAHWRHLLPISFVVYATIALLGVVLALTLTWLGVLISIAISIVGIFWMQGALVHAVDDIRDGRADASLATTFERAKPHLPAVIPAGILALVGVLLGLVLLIVPGLVLLTRWVLVIPVVVLERTSAGESFGRSRELVRGYGWEVFRAIILTLLLLLGFTIVLSIVLSPVADWLQSFVSNIVSGTLTAPFVALTWTLLYHRLRQAKAGSAAADATGAGT